MVVAPYAGAWVEIFKNTEKGVDRLSLPTRERGLKFWVNQHKIKPFLVAPYAGAWVEILLVMGFTGKKAVAPYAGAWVEITLSMSYSL